MNVLMVTSESVPFSKSGGLADVVGALSRVLVRQGHTVAIVMPLYGSVDQSTFSSALQVGCTMLGHSETVEVRKAVVDGVDYLGLAHPWYTDRKGIYGDDSFSPYADNCPRFALMCKAAVEIARQRDVDIIHCHDWTAGLVPMLAKEAGLRCASVMTVHNLAYMGTFSRYDALLACLHGSGDMLDGFGLQTKVNFLKTGLMTADSITTVSPTYAKEIQGAEQGCGLDWLLKQRADRLEGVINGIDTDEWDSTKDSFFSEHFSADDLSGKAALKERIQRQFGLAPRPDVPLFAMISRLAEQKGFGPLLDGQPCALETVLSTLDCQFIIIGTGDERYVSKLRDIASRHDNISVNIIFSQAVSHQVEGGADFFLMPSKYEPCGLNQMYSLRYGTLPVVHRTGGLADTVRDMDGEDGDGFLFENAYSDEIVAAVRRACAFYADKQALDAARRRAMAQDFSWNKSALEYARIYANTIGGKQA